MLFKAQYAELYEESRKKFNTNQTEFDLRDCWPAVQVDADRAITATCHRSGAIRTDPKEMNNTISIYCKILYTSEYSECLETQSKFLKSICIPSMQYISRNI